MQAVTSKSGGHSSLRSRSFSCCRAPALGHVGPVIAILEPWSPCSGVVAHGLRCSEACGIFPEPGIEPVSPALAGGFFTTGPPGKPLQLVFTVSHEIFLVRHWGSLVEACGIWFPDQGSNLGPPLHWEQSLSCWTTRDVLQPHSDPSTDLERSRCPAVPRRRCNWI